MSDQPGTQRQERYGAIADQEAEAEAERVEPAAGEGVSEAEAGGGGDDRETGELYGVRTPHAGDTDLAAPEHRESFDGSERGESFLESLATHAAEGGPVPEEEVVIVDDSDGDRGHSSTESGNRPVADKGSGGPGGL
jgi:hypothetical protein